MGVAKEEEGGGSLFPLPVCHSARGGGEKGKEGRGRREKTTSYIFILSSPSAPSLFCLHTHTRPHTREKKPYVTIVTPLLCALCEWKRMHDITLYYEIERGHAKGVILSSPPVFESGGGSFTHFHLTIFTPPLSPPPSPREINCA